MDPFHLNRFIESQQTTYAQALKEIKNGRKQSHWMWFIFPQLKGLGRSHFAEFYGIENLKEADEYLNHPILGPRLIEISTSVLDSDIRSARELFGVPDDMKLQSSMTLFSQPDNAPEIFTQVLLKYFSGQPDIKTLEKLNQSNESF